MIATQGKTGTTLISHICNMIRSDGDMNYEDINDVIPYPAIAYMTNHDLEADHKYQPRMFKSHEMVSQLYGDKCRYIVSMRHPLKQTISAYDFFDKKIEIRGKELDLDEYLRQNIEKRRLLEYHIEYWRARHCSDNLLIVHYEDMIKNMDKAIKVISNFMGIKLTDKQIQKYVSMTTKQYMQQHINKFDDSVAIRRSIENNHCLWNQKAVSKVTTGEHHKKYILSQKDIQFYEKAWKIMMESETGFSSYEDYAKEVVRINNKKWL